MTESINNLNKVIIALTERGLKQKDIAKTLDYSASYINKLYKGIRVKPSLRFIACLCEKYSVNRDYLLNGIGPMFIQHTVPLPEAKTDTFEGKAIPGYKISEPRAIYANLAQFGQFLPTDVWMARILEDLVIYLVKEKIIPEDAISEEAWSRIEYRKNLRKRGDGIYS